MNSDGSVTCQGLLGWRIEHDKKATITSAKAALKKIAVKTAKLRRLSFVLTSSIPGVLPYMGYIGTCGPAPKGMFFIPQRV